MNHLGDITKISGYHIEPVDVVIGGSPCQDLSVAGRRAGLAGERSGLLMEQIRIVKELRKADENRGRPDELCRPRYMLWENVPGAFSTNEGKDFQAVLEETARIIAPDTVISGPPGGRWRTCGCILGNRWSIAWRVLDAEFWGVPQRRRRIALIADFGGHAAPEILFIRKGLLPIAEIGRKTRKETSGTVGGSAYPTVAIRIRGGKEGGGKGPLIQIDKSGTLGCTNDQTIISFKDELAARGLRTYQEVTGTLDCGMSGAANQNAFSGMYPCDGETVRRLTPLECERLQGFPDGWTNIGPWVDSKGRLHKESSDNARYHALGNSIAIPPWKWVLKRISATYERDATMGSLFDGIGGFPYIWEQYNGKGSAVWASEIEEFPMAVTRRHFAPDEQEEKAA